MKKRTCLLLLFVCTLSCTRESGSITGSWVTDMPDQPQHKQGFTLKADGNAVAINLGEVNYENWEKQGDRLIIYGNSGTDDQKRIADTLKIISVADSTLILERNGEKFSYSKTVSPDKLITDFEIYECFAYKAKKDSAFMHINVADSIVTGELVYLFFEKDKNQGKINGVMRGDTLLATYTFVAEGTESTREVAFLKKGSAWQEGFGTVIDQNGQMIFKDRSKLNFRKSFSFKGVKCPEMIE
ncbi:lipocalin family protein [Dyadobacter pollutisoli]|uniref:Lipocalin family protein n=1 Tax=Dyadobacter pollutisoli TaxID=2910158 RepID=A0A9E8SJ60_9BACT|nr:lipocalin family protein [Dyadobacter pollutisoli]WAC09839.1 lipocalin family protein [Dyadobacter pollutisoli]